MADIRVGDVATPCHAAAAKALLDAGYSIALIPMMSDAIGAEPYRIDPDMQALMRSGVLHRVAPEASIVCTLALCFDARVFATAVHRLPQINARHSIVTVERPAAFAALDRDELERMRHRAEISLGGAVMWCPTSLMARDAMACVAPDWAVTDEDWAPVAPDLSHVETDATERARPTIGRARIARSRPTAEWHEPFLSNPLVALRHRGVDTPAARKWPQKAPVEIWSQDTITLAAFLSKVDLLANADDVHDDPIPVEALMALSAGVVPCLPEGYRETFGSAAIYGTDDDLVHAAIEIKLHPDMFCGLRDAADLLLQEMFAPGAFAARVMNMIGNPSIPSFAPIVHTEPGTRILFYSSNGIGMGHLTRQLAVARRLSDRMRPCFVSHSRAVDTVRQFGFTAEHLPYHSTYGEAKAHWNMGLARAFETALDFYKPSVVVFDGNMPFIGFLNALLQHPQTATVWIRRAMWGSGRDAEALDRAASFDLVIEPLDPAWANDRGPTVERQSEVRVIPPVRILDTVELLPREDACAQLGLDPNCTNVLIATGAGNNFDTAAITSRVIDHLHGRAGLGLALAEWQIAESRMDVPTGVVRLLGFPFAKYLSAFDLAVATPGYNTFCEHLAAGLPTIWVPNENDQMDQHLERAHYAVARRCGLLVRSAAPFDVVPALSQLLNPTARTAMALAGQAVAEQCMMQNGARDIAGFIADLAVSSLSRSPHTE